MFWGLIMEPQKKYSQTVKKAFRITMAALDVTGASDESVQVMCGYEDRRYLLCTLHKDKTVQCSLDLCFDVGNEVSFITNGESNVHLTGYLVLDEDLFDSSEDEGSEEDANISFGCIDANNVVSDKRARNPVKELPQNGLAAKLSRKLENASHAQPPAKKSKTAELLMEPTSEDDEDDEDVIFSDSDELDEQGEEEEGDELGEEEEEEDDDDDDEEHDEDDDDDTEMEDIEEEEADEVATKQNGSAKSKKAIEPKKKQDTKAPQEKKSNKKQAQQQAQQAQQQQQKSPQKRVIEGGLIVEDIRPGNGQVAKPGKMVQVYYEGRFKTNNKVFDSATKGTGFKFRLGRGEVIKGWDVGVAGMKIGGKRRLTCPPQLAYGKKGSPPTIPPNSTLVFEVELKNVS